MKSQSTYTYYILPILCRCRSPYGSTAAYPVCPVPNCWFFSVVLCQVVFRHPAFHFSSGVQWLSRLGQWLSCPIRFHPFFSLILCWSSFLLFYMLYTFNMDIRSMACQSAIAKFHCYYFSSGKEKRDSNAMREAS